MVNLESFNVKEIFNANNIENIKERLNINPEVDFNKNELAKLDNEKLFENSYESFNIAPKEISDERIVKQDDAIFSVECGVKSIESNKEKGNYGEMKMDQYLRELGYERISNDMITSLDDSGHQGIDGVYYNADGKPPYVIADAKFGSSKLAETLDGKQMSVEWIAKRLDESVGKDLSTEIQMQLLLNRENVGTYVINIDKEGNINSSSLDDNGNVIEKDVTINA